MMIFFSKIANKPNIVKPEKIINPNKSAYFKERKKRICKQEELMKSCFINRCSCFYDNVEAFTKLCDHINTKVLTNQVDHPFFGKLYDPLPKTCLFILFFENYYLCNMLISNKTVNIDRRTYNKLFKFKLNKKIKYMMNLIDIDARTFTQKYFIPNEFVIEMYKKEKNSAVNYA